MPIDRLSLPLLNLLKNKFIPSHFNIFALLALFSLMYVGSSTVLFALSLASYETSTSTAKAEFPRPPITLS